MNILKQLETIKTKDELHKFIDKIPDDVPLKGLILIDESKEDERMSRFTFHEVGPITIAESIYMTESYKHLVIFGEEDDDA